MLIVLVVKLGLLHSSTAAPGPPIHNAAAAVPVAEEYPLTAFKSVVSAQLDPFHNSVNVDSAPDGGEYPPKAREEVLSAPAPAIAYLGVFKSATSVQLVPFQDSVLP